MELAGLLPQKRETMTDKRLKLALHVATPPMRKPILEFAARRFRVVGVQVFYDAENELGREVAVEFVSPDDGDGSAFVIHEDGSVTEA